MSLDHQRWFLGATLLEAGRGGIARVARITARTLLDEGAELTMLSLLDEQGVSIVGHKPVCARGNRLAYAAHCHKAALFADRFIYDSVGTARAHPRLPGLRKPYGVWIHGVEVWHRLGADRARALRGAALVLVNSQFTLDKFQQIHWPLPNAHVCHLATEEDEPPAIAPQFDGPPTVLIVARVDAGEMYKGHKELMESWPDVVRAVPQARLILVGGGSGLDDIQALRDKSVASANIEIRGYVEEKDLADLWRKAHIFAMPSRGEGFGLVYIEAMRHGLPVIASVHDAGCEVNVDGVTGYNVDLDIAGELSGRLIALLGNVDTARAMGQAGYQRWHGHFRYTHFKQRLREKLVD